MSCSLKDTQKPAKQKEAAVTNGHEAES